MRRYELPDPTESTVVRQAAACAAEAVRTMLLDAQRAAARCGCSRCREGDSATRRWATAMSASPVISTPAATDRPVGRRSPWDYW